MKKGYHDVDEFYPEDEEKTETAKSGRNELLVIKPCPFCSAIPHKSNHLSGGCVYADIQHKKGCYLNNRLSCNQIYESEFDEWSKRVL